MTGILICFMEEKPEVGTCPGSAARITWVPIEVSWGPLPASCPRGGGWGPETVTVTHPRLWGKIWIQAEPHAPH